MLAMAVHRYGGEMGAYRKGQSNLASPPPWFKHSDGTAGAAPRCAAPERGGVAPQHFPRFRHVQLPGDPHNMAGWDDAVERDTVKLCAGSSYRRCLLGACLCPWPRASSASVSHAALTDDMRMADAAV